MDDEMSKGADEVRRIEADIATKEKQIKQQESENEKKNKELA